MIFIHHYHMVYRRESYWHPVGWHEDEQALKKMVAGTYALHEGSQTVIEEGPDDTTSPLPTQLNFIGIRYVQTPEGIPDNAPVAGIVDMVVTKPKKPKKPKKEKT